MDTHARSHPPFRPRRSARRQTRTADGDKSASANCARAHGQKFGGPSLPLSLCCATTERASGRRDYAEQIVHNLHYVTGNVKRAMRACVIVY